MCNWSTSLSMELVLVTRDPEKTLDACKCFALKNKEPYATLYMHTLLAIMYTSP